MNLFEEFQEFRKILCLCPHCQNIYRVSDLKLKVKGPTVSTWLDNYEKKSRVMDKKEEKFDEVKEKLRELAVEKGRREAQKVFNRLICPVLRTFKIDPFDIKPIFNPVDFVVFNGMNQKEKVSNIIFLSKVCNNSFLNNARQQVKNTIQNKRYDWQVARINEQGQIEIE